MKRFVVALLLVLSPLALGAAGIDFAAANDVTWDCLGTNENSSMPLGNGDLALNVWTEQNGDIVLLLAKAPGAKMGSCSNWGECG
jgi:alpha-L-fucosidase 2